MACGCGALQGYQAGAGSRPAPQAAVESNSKSLPAVASPENVPDMKIERAPLADSVSSTSSVQGNRASAAQQAIVDSNKAAAASALASKASADAARAAAAAAAAAQAAAQAAGTASPSAQATPTPLMLSATSQGPPAQERQHVSDLIDGVKRTITAIDQHPQSADGLRRVALAERFLKSAQQAFAEGSYAEAGSLADKASTMLAPLTATRTKGS